MTPKSKKHKRLYIILGIISALLIIGIFSLNSILSSIVKKEIGKQLNANPESLYNFEFEDIRINIFTGSVKVINLEVAPTDSAETLLHAGKINKLVHSHIPVFKIKELKILKFIQTSVIHIKEIDLTGFTVE